MSTLELTSRNVEKTMADCLFQVGEEPTWPRIHVEGILNNYAFHPGRIEEHQQAIHDLLLQLPHEFRQSEGGGWSFLNMCMTFDGVQWTGMHLVLEWLMVGGMAAGWAIIPPRHTWVLFYAQMPYVTVLDERRKMQVLTEIPKEDT